MLVKNISTSQREKILEYEQSEIKKQCEMRERFKKSDLDYL